MEFKDEPIALADAVAALRDELLEAAKRGVGRDVTFAVGDVVMEFEVELHKDDTKQFGVSAWAVTGDREHASGSRRTHRVSITLSPHGKDGKGPMLIAGEPRRMDGPGDLAGHIGR